MTGNLFTDATVVIALIGLIGIAIKVFGKHLPTQQQKEEQSFKHIGEILEWYGNLRVAMQKEIDVLEEKFKDLQETLKQEREAHLIDTAQQAAEYQKDRAAWQKKRQELEEERNKAYNWAARNIKRMKEHNIEAIGLDEINGDSEPKIKAVK